MKKYLRCLTAAVAVVLLPAMASANSISIDVTGGSSGPQILVTGLPSGGNESFGLGDLGFLAGLLGDQSYTSGSAHDHSVQLFNPWRHKHHSVPEPGELSLLALGACGLLWVGMRRRRRSLGREGGR